MRALALLTLAACASAAPPPSPEPEPAPAAAPEPEPAKPDAAIELLRARLPGAIAGKDLAPLASLIAADRAVSVTASCGARSSAEGGDAVRAVLADLFEEVSTYKSSWTADCAGACCRIDSGAPEMCEVCTGVLEVCVDGGAISAIKAEDTTGVICEPDQTGVRPPEPKSFK